MTLEDFFTLTELNDGLTDPDRVNDLITVLQKEKDTAVKSFGEATRQWSTVACTIAATENKDCLDLFIRLDGLCFIDGWLNEAQKTVNDTGNNILEESVTVMLGALEHLQIDAQKSVSSGIAKTVQDLVSNSSSAICDKAKALCDRWAALAPENVKKLEAHGDDGNDNDENNVEQSREQTMPLVSSDTVQQATVNNEETTNQDGPEYVDLSGKSGHDGKDLLVNSEATEPKSEGTEACGVGQSDVSEPDKHVKDAKEETDKEGLVEMSTLSSPLEQIASTALESAIKTDPRGDKDEDMVENGASPDHFRSTMSVETRNEIEASGANEFQDLSGDEYKWGEAESPKTSSSSESDGEADVAKKDGNVQSNNENLGNGSRFLRTSDMELDYGMVDPLELARQVAIEVERELDSREQSCSTSDKTSGGGIERPNNPDSINGKDKEEVSSGREPSPKPVKDPQTLVSERASCKPDITASQISEVAQESERGFSGFDLNQEVCSEEVDDPINPVSPLISIVSASRAAAATGSPVGPLQFEGALGWKGSASTSAFRRVPEGDKALSNSKKRLDCLDFDLNVAEESEDKIEDLLSRTKMPVLSGFLCGESSSIEASSGRPERPQLDLNSLGDGGAEPVCLDGRVAFFNQNGWQSPSRSSSSSSKQPCLRNTGLNLNDEPVFTNGHPFLGKLSNHASGSGSGAFKQQESVISIFGTKVEVKRDEFVPQPRIPTVDFNMGRAGAGAGMGMNYNNNPTPLYGPMHNGFASGGGMFLASPGVPMPMPMPMHMQMQMPYMVDSRGTPVMPQVMGFNQTPPRFMTNVGPAGPSSGSQHSFDLNAGLMMDGGNNNNKNSGGLRQLFHHNGRPFDEEYSRARANNSVQASSSGVVGGKRNEPEGGWEFFPVSKHHQQPPWR